MQTQIVTSPDPGSKPIRNIAVVGARALSPKYTPKIQGIVAYLLDHDFHIATGGAMGCDDHVIASLIYLNQCNRGTIFSAWDNFKAFPVKVRKNIRLFSEQGGEIVWGVSSGNQHASAIKLALLARNTRLVQASNGVTAFLTEQSRGTFFTVQKAIEQRKRLVIFPIDRELPGFKVVKWVPLTCGGFWEGAFKAVYLR